MIAFIEDHKEDIGVEPICRHLPIAPSTFYDHMAKRTNPDLLSDRAKRDDILRPEIKELLSSLVFEGVFMRRLFLAGIA